MGNFREKIENWLAPENVRSGMPTYLPRQKRQYPNKIDEASIGDESADEPVPTEDTDSEVSKSQNDNRAQAFSGMCGGLALQHQASLQNQLLT